MRSTILLLIVCQGLFVAQSAPAIVTSSPVNDPIVLPGQTAYGIDFRGVAVVGGALPNASQLEDIIFQCTGSLISDRHILSAAHCYDEDFDGKVDPLFDGLPLAVGFQLADRAEILLIDPQQSRIAPGWIDLAVLTLETSAPADIPRYALYGKSDELGQEVVLGGYGSAGYGAVGTDAEQQPLQTSTLRAGLNRYEAIPQEFDEQYLLYDFDSGLPENNAFAYLDVASDLGLGEAEVMPAHGDSGGPAFLDGAIAGVISTSIQPLGGDVDALLDSSWGELAADARVSASRDLILEATGGAAKFLDDVFPGDYNGNGLVEQADLDLVLLNWGSLASPPPAGWVNDLPIGIIDQQELDSTLLNWGNVAAVASRAPAAVPEPRASALLLFLATGFAIALRSTSLHQ